ncbi:MAG: hypothetical protein CSA36_08345 [Draconibacterium sp.]|nr:MAG: hypothetical protein CSA36_08345 [Draconibacterium sp.]
MNKKFSLKTILEVKNIAMQYDINSFLTCILLPEDKSRFVCTSLYRFGLMVYDIVNVLIDNVIPASL